MKSSLELGAIGNCQVAALVDPEGSIVWCCLPRLDGDPVFSSLLTAGGSDAAQGVFSIQLAQLRECRQGYISNTAVLETVLVDDQGNSLRITDFCPRFCRHLRFGDGRTFELRDAKGELLLDERPEFVSLHMRTQTLRSAGDLDHEAEIVIDPILIEQERGRGDAVFVFDVIPGVSR